MAKKDTPTDPSSMSRRKQIAESYRMAKKTDTALPWWILGAFVVGAAIGFGIFWILPGSGAFAVALSALGALLFGTLAALIVFGRRAQRAAYGQMEGQPGAAGSALRLLKRGWKSDIAVAFNKQQDVMHRVVGPPGIVLIGEGNRNRLKQLMGSERRKHERVAAEVPIHEIYVGRGEGEVPLPKLVRHIQKLGRQVKPAEITDVIARIRALDAQRPKLPVPKGPMPTSMKGMRGQMRGR